MMQSVLASLRPAVVALIASAGLSILGMVLFGKTGIDLNQINWLGAALFAGAFALLRKYKWNPIVTMVLCGAVFLLGNMVFA